MNEECDLPNSISYFIDSVNNKRYEFDVSKSFLLYNYFFHHPENFKAGSEIIITNIQDIPFDSDAISSFITYCQTQDVNITNSNVFQLNILSKQFLIKDLLTKTEHHIKENYSGLILESFLYKIKMEKTSEIEDQITNHLSEYIKKPQFKSLPFDSIYRIITHYNQNDENNDAQTEKDIKDFLIDYLNDDKDKATWILANLDFPFGDKDFILKFYGIYEQSIHIIAPKMAPIVLDFYNECKAEKIKEIYIKRKASEKDNYDEKTKTLKLSNKRITIKIGEFVNRDDIEIVEIPGSVKTIGQSAFERCKSIKKVVIGQGCQIIGDKAFASCENMKEIEIPSTMKQICSHAFSNCKSLEKIELPNLKVISQHLFEGCTGLKEIKIPESVTIIEQCAFQDCQINKIIIPDSVKSIGDAAFWRCKYLIHAELPNSIIKISKSLFQECCNLLSVNIPGHVTEIDHHAFYGCSNLQQISIPDSVIDIGGSSFTGCEKLSDINIPNSVKRIHGGAFWNCSQLKKDIFPKHLFPVDGEFFK